MPLQKLPVQNLDDINHRRRAREVLNQVLDHTFDDSRRQTSVEKRLGITPINPAYSPGHVDRYGTNETPGTTDMGPAIQAALTQMLNGGEYVQFKTNNRYRSNQQLTLQRSDAAHSTELVIFGNGANVYFPSLSGSQVGLTIGATSTDYFIEQGAITVNDLELIGPETGSALTDAASTTTVGLKLYIAGNVTLHNVQAYQFYNNYYSSWAFPVSGVGCNFRAGWVGMHFDESSNEQAWVSLRIPNCRFAMLIKSTTDTFDDGKTNNNSWDHVWIEGSLVGIVVDSGTGGGGNSRFRNFTFSNLYIARMTYDVFRFGTQWDYANPGTRGSACSEFIHDVRITDGVWNTAAWTSTHAAIAYDNTGRCKQFLVDIPVVTLEVNSNVFVNGPYGGVVRVKAYPTVSDGVVTEYLYNNSGSVARRFNQNGDILSGSNKAAAQDITQQGVEISNGGEVWATSDAAPAGRWNRTGSDGTLHAFYNDDTLAGSVDVVGATLVLIIDAANNVGIFTGSGSPEGVVTAGVGSTYHNRAGGTDTTLYTKNSGAGNTGWVAVDNV
jgi:hypothetical protein